MWRDFPDRLCAAAGCRALVWSRPGYGRSTPRASGERWPPSYMHHQALEVLPALLRALAVATPPWLLGHSDGASIALLHAARFAVAGCVVMAPHLFVEPVSLASIEQARRAYLDSDLRERLARYHDDPDSAFWGWNDIWLAPAFRDWNIEAEIAGIGAPLLAIQGLDDEYGTLAQIHAVARRVPQTRTAGAAGLWALAASRPARCGDRRRDRLSAPPPRLRTRDSSVGQSGRRLVDARQHLRRQLVQQRHRLQVGL
jgi:pimeloyl-ACP methyl ester carboxylesterase